MDLPTKKIIKDLTKLSNPHFIIAGVPKAGTTSIYEYLKNHENIFLTGIKETNYFIFRNKVIDFNYFGPKPLHIYNSVRNEKEYLNLFLNSRKDQVTGEISPFYFYSKDAINQIYAHLPKVKIIIILRNPINRAHSHYLQLVRDGREPIKSFYNALKEENRRIYKNFSPDYFYKENGLYSQPLKLFFNLFPSENIKVYIFEEFMNNLEVNLNRVCRFVGINKWAEFKNLIHYNASGIPKNRFIHSFLNNDNIFKKYLKVIFKINHRQRIKYYLNSHNLKKPTIDSEARTLLAKFYIKDIYILEKLLRRKLNIWYDNF